MHRDQDLIDRCLHGDEDAWGVLSDLIKRLTAGLSATSSLQADAQQDMTQEVLSTLLHDQCRALRQFAGRSLLSTYLATIVRRVAACHRQGHEPVADTEILEEIVGVTDTHASHVEMWTVIQQALSPTDVLILRLDAASYTSDEIAEMLTRLHNRPWRSETIRQRKSRAIRRVRRKMSESR